MKKISVSIKKLFLLLHNLKVLPHVGGRMRNGLRLSLVEVKVSTKLKEKKREAFPVSSSTPGPDATSFQKANQCTC